MPLVSVIVLNWNRKDLLDACLNSLAAQSFRDFEVVLLDNGSEDGSADYVRTHYPWVRLVELKRNIGFAGGNNRALEASRGDYIVTLNNDTKADPAFLRALVDAADADPHVGMVAAKMLNFYQPERIDSVGVKAAPNGMGYNIGVGETDAGQYDRPVPVFGPCAGAALYRRSLIVDVGFFDADFFAYYEDLDLAWRAQLAGWRCVTAPRAIVYHIHSATGGQGSPFTVYHIQRNKWYTLLKAWPLGLLLKQAPRILLYDAAALFLAIARGNGRAALKARWDVLKNLRVLFQKRAVVQRRRTLAFAAAAALLSSPEAAFKTLARKVRDRRAVH